MLHLKIVILMYAFAEALIAEYIHHHSLSPSFSIMDFRMFRLPIGPSIRELQIDSTPCRIMFWNENPYIPRFVMWGPATRGTSGLILAYPIHFSSFYDSLFDISLEFAKHTKRFPPVAVIGHKFLSDSPRCVSLEDGEQLAKRISDTHQVPTMFFEATPETKDEFDGHLTQFIRMILTQMDEEERER